MKKTNIKQGRPVKLPDGNLPDYIGTKVEKLFTSCGIETDSVALKAVWQVAVVRFYPGCEVAARDAEKFGQMFSVKPIAMTKLIGKVNALADKVMNNPQVRFVGYYCYLKRMKRSKYDAANSVLDDRIKLLETEKADKIASELRTGIKGLNATAVRNAREQIRKLSFT
jgi:hypothetical protein